VFELLDVPANFSVLNGWTAAPSLSALFSGPGRRYYYRDHSLFLKMSANPSAQPWHATDLVQLCMAPSCNYGAVLSLDLPSVTITSPADGARVPPGNIAVNANITDTNGIAAARLYLGTDLVAVDTAAPYNFIMTNIPAGSYALKLVAEDTTGRSYTAVQQLFVGDLAPRVEITNLTDNRTFNAGTPVSLAFNVFNWPVLPGGQHLHWFINGVDQGHLYNSAPISVTGLTQGRQELRVALAAADHTVKAINDQVAIYVVENGALADYEDGPDTRGTLFPADANMGMLSKIAFAWGNPMPLASRADGEDDINYYDVFSDGGIMSSATYRLEINPPQNWFGQFTKLELKRDGIAFEVFVVDQLDGPTSIGLTGPQTTVLNLPAAQRKLDQVVAIELRYPESAITPGSFVRTHLYQMRLLP
jgi:hypothetical protein